MNNRQANNNGRRRGRGGQRQQGGNPNQGNGNRIDNRARGNAAQLLEKYKNLARDAQMQGDRVNTEYYLQFADHYFRVLAESRSRFEEQDRQRRQRDDFDGDEDEFDEGMDAGGNEGESDEGFERQDRPDRGERQARPERNDRGDRPERADRRDGRRNNRDDRGPRRDDRSERNERPVQADVAESPAPLAANEDEVPREDTRRRRGRPRREEADAGDTVGIADVLPPALGVEGEVVVEAKPRRRRVKKDEGEAAAAE